MKLEDLGGGIWRWTLPHPEWRPTTQRVGCYAVRTGGDTVLIDPLFGDIEAVDAVVEGTVTVVVTVPYHVRSAAEAARRWDARIVGHPDLARRLPEGVDVHESGPGIALHPIPRHKERIVQVADALAIGDRIIGTGDGLRIWATGRMSERYRAQLTGWLQPLLELDFERVLTMHGDPVLRDGRAALAEALAADPV